MIFYLVSNFKENILEINFKILIMLVVNLTIQIRSICQYLQHYFVLQLHINIHQVYYNTSSENTLPFNFKELNGKWVSFFKVYLNQQKKNFKEKNYYIFHQNNKTFVISNI